MVTKELRNELLSLKITRSELYEISRIARKLGMSRPNLIIDAVRKYEKSIESLTQSPTQK
jgi:transposase-like protein